MLFFSNLILIKARKYNTLLTLVESAFGFLRGLSGGGASCWIVVSWPSANTGSSRNVWWVACRREFEFSSRCLAGGIGGGGPLLLLFAPRFATTGRTLVPARLDCPRRGFLAGTAGALPLAASCMRSDLVQILASLSPFFVRSPPRFLVAFARSRESLWVDESTGSSWTSTKVAGDDTWDNSFTGTSVSKQMSSGKYQN